MELMLKPEIFTYTKLSETEFKKYQEALLPVVVPLEQSPAWGNFNNTVAGREFLGSFSYTNASGKLVALASAILYSDRGRSWIWIKHGPLFAHEPNTDTIKNMCSTLKEQFQTIQSIQPLFIRLSMSQGIDKLRPPFEHTMYDETVIVDLENTEDEILAGMSQSGRAGIRKSAKLGVTVREITQDRSAFFAENCYPILRETGARDGFGIHPQTLYTSMLKELKNEARLYVATDKGKVEAWAITTEYNSQSMYYYGGSSAHARNTFAAYALHWEVIKEMRRRGNKTYDFMGIAGKNFEGLKNVTQFKIKFSKNIIKIPFTYDLPLQTLKYNLLSFILRAKRILK